MDAHNLSLSIFDNSPQPFCVIRVEVDAQGKPEDWTFLYCNDALARLEGYPKEELLGHRFYDVFPDGDRKWLKPYYEAAYEKKGSSFDSVSDEVGQYLHIDCFPLDETGVCGCLLRSTGRSEEYYWYLEAEKANRANQEKTEILQRTETFYQNLLENAACGIVSYILPEHKNLYMNAEALRAFGFQNLEEADIQMKETLKTAVFSNPDDLQNLAALEKEDGLVDYECRITKKNESTTSLLGHSEVITNPLGERVAYTTFLDVTENKQLQSINDTLENQNYVISGLSREYSAVWYVTNQGRTSVKFQTSEQAGVAGDARYSEKKEIDYHAGMQAYIDNYVCEDIREEFAQKVQYETVQQEIRKQPVYSVTYRRAFQGKKEYFQANFTMAGGGEDDFVVGFKNVNDVMLSEIRKNEALATALAAAEHANRAKTQFLNNMSHDIRTPMNAIIGFTSLAGSHIDNKEMVKEYLRKISTSSEHLLSLINDVLDMSRIESGKVKIDASPLHLPELLHDIRTIIQPTVSSKQLDFLIDTVDVVDEDIIADKLRLTQVLLNILGNGVKFNKTGGMLSLRIKQEKKAPKGYAKYHFIIRDTGIGMSQEFQKHIFESFTRAETTTVSGIQGTGLGMTITKRIVDMMGGTIGLKSEVGIGSEFDVCLTFRLSGEKKDCEKIEELQGLKVLVADDDTDTCISISKMLTEIGMRSEWTVSGKEAIIRAKVAVEMEDAFYAYIIDWLMPDMNGIETARRIRRVIGDDRPIIILTAYDWSDVEEEAKEAGVTAFCEKPLFMSELQNLLSKPVSEEAKEEKEEFDCTGKRILLVEDNVLNQEIAQTVLEDAGFLVETANDGVIAVEKIKQAEKGQYDLVLMDIQMPIMNGYEATKRIRALNSEMSSIPIIAMTANAFGEDREKAFATGMNGHLAKPINPKKLVQMIRKVMK